jgi:hypothetical protein
MMSNPILLVNFARMAQELSQGYDDHPGFNARQKGWLRLFSGPAGFSILANPDALLGITKAYGLMDGYSPEGESELGQVMRWMKGLGYGMYPWLDGLLNMTGTYGNTFEPDMLGIRHRAIVGAAVNELLAQTGQVPGASPYADLSASARERVSTWISSFAPGWVTQPVPAVAEGNIAAATIEKQIENRIIANNPGMTFEQLAQIMDDQESPEYQAAWKQVAKAGFVGQLLTFTAPTGMKSREDSADARNAGLGIIYDTAKKQGVDPADLNPAADAQFASRFEALTGKKWTPRFFDQASLERNLAQATPQARPLILQTAQYYALDKALPEAGKLNEQMNRIRSGEWTPPGYPTNVLPESRGDMAEYWLRQQPTQDQAQMQRFREARKAFRAATPEFGAYMDWRDQMYAVQDLYGAENGLARYRELVMQGNPNAARFLQAKIRDIASKTTDPAKRRAMLDDATMSQDFYLAVKGLAKNMNDARATQTSTPQSSPYEPSSGMVPPEPNYPSYGGSQNAFANPDGSTNWSTFLSAFGVS